MINKVIIVGRTGKDPEVQHLDNGTAVAKITVATNEVFKNKQGEKVENTEWHNVVLWRGLAEVVEKYVKKGDLIYIEGKLKTRTWDDKNGSKHYTTEIIADTMQMLGGKKSDRPEAPPLTEDDIPANITEEDDLPFS